MADIHNNIIVQNLYKRFGDQAVLNGLNATFEKGKISFIMGESGVGKTTLFRILMGLEKEDSGILEGIEKNTEISAVFQEDRLFENLTALRNVLLVCERKVSVSTVCNQIHQLLPQGTEYKKVCELSGGMRKRIAIIRAMLAPSDIILMDEPFVGLDYENKVKVWDYVKENQRGRTILIITHDQEELEYFEADCFTF